MYRKMQAFGALFIATMILIAAANRLSAPSTTAITPAVTLPPSSPTPAPSNPLPSSTPTPIPAAVAQAVITTITQAPLISPTIPVNATLHIVESGDNLYRIAQRYGVTISSIAALNNMVDMNRVFIGQQLWIPAPGQPTASSMSAVTLTPLPTVFVPTITSEPVTLLASPALATVVQLAPTLTPLPPDSVNGIARDLIIVLPDSVQQHIREIFAHGQDLRRNPRAFSKLGDSTIENPFFLTRFDTGSYNLGEYAYLEEVIDFYAGSFGRESMAVRRGLHTWSVFDPMWSSSPYCQPREGLLECEIRLHNPSIIFIRLGSNDAGVPEKTEENFREIIEFLVNNGIIPILGTKADRHEGGDNTNNNIIRRLVAEYNVPLWDFDLVAQTIPGRGLDQDGVHMTTFYAHDWTSPVGFQRGYGVHNLTALIALDAVWRVITAPA